MTDAIAAAPPAVQRPASWTLYRQPTADVEIPPPTRQARALHRALGGSSDATPLRALPELAAALRVAHLGIKLETNRFGLPSFKVLGASWATIEALRPVLPAWWRPEDGLEPLAGALPALTLVAATDGNHGHALARVARILGLKARIFVPEMLSPTRQEAIEREGADVVRTSGTYDDAVAQSALDSEREGRVLVSDTSWPGYERVPAAVIDGYSTIFWEVEEQLVAAGNWPPDLVFVQLGVGAFGAAAIRHFCRPGIKRPRIVGLEPTKAACVMASLAADRRITIPGAQDSVMTGLNCGTPSLIAWPLLRGGLNAVIAIDDEQAVDGARILAGAGLAVGECSGAALAAAVEILAGPDADVHRARLGVSDAASVLLFATEGVTAAAAPALM